MIKEPCKNCGKYFPRNTGRDKRRKFCTLKCSREWDRKEWESINGPRIDMASGTVGAISELVVSADLLRRGFAVFRALSPTCSCDLVVLMRGALIRIEVRTAWLNKAGDLMGTLAVDETHRSDVMALVSRDGTRIEYRPDPFRIEQELRASEAMLAETP